jgi:signal transduction histidine kinase
MTDAAPVAAHSLVVQKQLADPSQQPLEVYHLSHDLRGPLNSILGFAELLLEGIEGPLNEIQQADVAAIYQSAQNLLYLINTLVDLSKLEANRLNFEFKPVNLTELLETVFSPAATEQIAFSAVLPSSLPLILGDRDRLEQMFRSLLKFVLKLTRKGPFTLAAESDDANSVTLRLEVEQAKVTPAEAAELFELIVKVDATGRIALGPGGLDLPLVRRLVEQQRGRVWAESQSNGNLTIFLSLPIAEAAT